MHRASKHVSVWLGLLIPFVILWLSIIALPGRADEETATIVPPVRMELLGHIGGRVRAVDARGDYAYHGEGMGLTVLNVSDPTHPQRLSHLPLPQIVYGIKVSGHYAYVADGDAGLYIVDISDPVNPAEVSHLDTPGWVYDVDVSNNYVYAADGTGGLRIINVLDPANPVEIGTYVPPAPALGIRVVGGYAYLANEVSGLRIVSLADVGNPTLISQVDTPGIAQDVDIAGTYACVADRSGGLRVISVAVPQHPYEVSSFNTGCCAEAVTTSNMTAYVAAGGGLRIISLADPANLYQLSFLDTPDWARDVALLDATVLLATDYTGLGLVDASNLTSPTEVGRAETIGSAQSVVVSGGYAYVVDAYAGLRSVSVSQPEHPRLVGSYSPPAYIQNLQVGPDGNLYLADGSGGLRILSIANPAAPAELGAFVGSMAVQDVQVTAGVAYLAEGSGVRSVDVATPASPHPLGNTTTSNNARALDVSPGFAYAVGDSAPALTVISATSPITLTEAGHVLLPGAGRDVRWRDGLAYVAAGDAGLLTVDVARPFSPTILGGVSLPAASQRLDLDGDYAFVTAGAAGVRVVELPDPVWPYEVGRYEAPGWSRGIFADPGSDRVYVGAGDAGLLILRYVVDVPPDGSFAIAGGPSTQTTPALAFASSAGVYLLAWADAATGVQGRLWSPAAGFQSEPFTIAPASYDPSGPQVAYSSSADEFLVVWYDFRDGLPDVFARRVTPEGGLVGDEITVSGATNAQYLPTVAYNPDDDEYLVAWSDRRSSGATDIYGQRVASDGTLIGMEISICTASGDQWNPAVAFGSTRGEYLVVWEDWRDNPAQPTLYAQRVAADGSLVGDNFTILPDAFDLWHPSVAYSPAADRFIVVWEDRRGNDADIVARHMHSDGTSAGAEFTVVSAAGDQGAPAAADEPGQATYFVVWQDGRDPQMAPDLHARRVAHKDGIVGSELVISDYSGGQEQPAAGADAAGGILITWQDGRTGNADVRARFLPGPTPTPTATPTATNTPGPSPTPTATSTPTVTPTSTETPTPTMTPTVTPTATPSPTDTATPTPTVTPSATPSPTVTPTATATPTATPTPVLLLRYLPLIHVAGIGREAADF